MNWTFFISTLALIAMRYSTAAGRDLLILEKIRCISTSSGLSVIGESTVALAMGHLGEYGGKFVGAAFGGPEGEVVGGKLGGWIGGLVGAESAKLIDKSGWPDQLVIYVDEVQVYPENQYPPDIHAGQIQDLGIRLGFSGSVVLKLMEADDTTGYDDMGQITILASDGPHEGVIVHEITEGDAKYVLIYRVVPGAGDGVGDDQWLKCGKVRCKMCTRNKCHGDDWKGVTTSITRSGLRQCPSNLHHIRYDTEWGPPDLETRVCGPEQ